MDVEQDEVGRRAAYERHRVVDVGGLADDLDTIGEGQQLGAHPGAE